MDLRRKTGVPMHPLRRLAANYEKRRNHEPGQPVLFEETQKTLFYSDLFHHVGDVEPLTDVVGRSHQSLKEYQAGILAACMAPASRVIALGRLTTST
jgi:hypothetical protein